MAISVLLPKGWFQMNHVALMHGYQLILNAFREALRGPNQLEARSRVQGKWDPVDQYIQEVRSHPDPRTFVCGMLLPALSRSMDKTLRAQAAASLGMTACALERYRLANGKYPVSLKELVPAYLDTVTLDPLNNEPLHYRVTDEGWFQLWSVGLDRKDDGGVLHSYGKDGNPVGPDLDLPWPSPKLSREARLF